jgi:ABC-type transport system involved in Fe-S cluster assembly fused permease/ATPase subunit
MVDMENLFELFGTESRVSDEPGAPELRLTEGGVVFDQV